LGEGLRTPNLKKIC